CAHLPLAVSAAGAIIHYVAETQKGVLGQLNRLSTYATDNFMALDVQTQRNLELFQSARTGTNAGSLLSVVDLTKTPMGGRLLRRWMGQPLLDLAELTRRQDAIGWFVDRSLARNQAISLLGGVADLERLINRVRGEIAIPRELVALRRSLETVPRVREIIEGDGDDSTIGWLKDELKPCQEVVDLIAEALVDEPSSSLGEGGVIRTGFSEDLDSLRLASGNAKKYLANMERQERERT
ncbi:unnamed protein product, partial [marine sediment metagenome]